MKTPASAAACACPEVFSLRDDGFAEAAPGPVPESAQETAAEAMDACPTSAIEEG